MTVVRKPEADWLGWVIQLACGFIAGCLLGYVLICGGRSHRCLLAYEDVLPWVGGAGLLMGAIATKLGDRLWMGGRYSRFLPPEEIQQSRTSSLCTVVIGLAGVMFMVFALIRTLGLMGR